MQLAIYGNLIYDQLVVVDGLTIGQSNQSRIITSIGGIANVYRALAQSELKLLLRSVVGDDVCGLFLRDCVLDFKCDNYIDFVHGSSTKAVVIVDKALCVRTGFVDWGLCRSEYYCDIFDGVDWHHFMYLDTMVSFPDEFKNIKGVVSVDFCCSDKVFEYSEYFPFIDYLFASESEFLLENIDKINVRKGVILHSPGRVVSVIDGKRSEVEFVVVGGLNVCGAGDYFAAYVISNILYFGECRFGDVYDRVLKLLRKQS